MAKDQKAEGKTEQAKEAVGRAVGNESMTAKGKAQQAKADARQAREKTEDVSKH